MKTKKLFLALTLPIAFAACSNDEFIEDNATPTKGNLVELGEGFGLAVQGTNDASTRGVWEQGTDGLGWSWLPTILANNTGANSMLGSLNVATDEIGLCWTGELPNGTGSISNMVYTNYQFLHNGWLAEKQYVADFDECTSALVNGKFYDGIDEGSLSETSTLTEIKSQLTAAANQVEITDEKGITTDTKLNLNTGIFKTSNKAIFGGSYIAYYPYNDAFADAASLPAVSPIVYNDVTTGSVSDAHVAKNTFMVGYAQNLIGGSQASKLSLSPLSGIISLQVSGTTSKTITKVALWSQDGFVKKVGLDASKIKSLGAAAGEALYVGTKETASTIIADLANPASLSTTVKIYLPVLPTIAKDLKAIVYANDKSIAVVSLGDQTFKAAQGTVVKVAANNFKANALVAVDESSLKDAAGGTYADPATVTVIGDITLTADLTINENLTVEGGKIIVPEDITLTMSDGSTIKSAVEVQAQTCCSSSSKGGKMVVEAGATIAGSVNVEGGYLIKDVEKKAGSLEFGHTATKTSIVANTAAIVSDGPIGFKGATDIRGTLTVNSIATLSTENSDVNVKGGTVINNGLFEVTKGKFAMLNANGETVAAAGKNFKNNGTFIDNVGTIIGGSTQYMTFGAEGNYICYVEGQARLDEAYKNKTACSTIRFVNASATTFDLLNACKHNDKFINLVDAGTTTTIESSSDAAAAIGNLTVVKNSALTVSATGTIQVNGNISLRGSFTTAEDVQGMTAKNLIIDEDGSATFGNRSANLGVTLAVSSTIEVMENGTFTITNVTTGKNIADVTCKKLIEGGTFNGKPRVIE